VVSRWAGDRPGRGRPLAGAKDRPDGAGEAGVDTLSPLPTMVTAAGAKFGRAETHDQPAVAPAGRSLPPGPAADKVGVVPDVTRLVDAAAAGAMGVVSIAGVSGSVFTGNRAVGGGTGGFVWDASGGAGRAGSGGAGPSRPAGGRG
jgi:hypothetical protein